MKTAYLIRYINAGSQRRRWATSKEFTDPQRATDLMRENTEAGLWVSAKLVMRTVVTTTITLTELGVPEAQAVLGNGRPEGGVIRGVFEARTH